MMMMESEGPMMAPMMAPQTAPEAAMAPAVTALDGPDMMGMPAMAPGQLTHNIKSVVIPNTCRMQCIWIPDLFILKPISAAEVLQADHQP